MTIRNKFSLIALTALLISIAVFFFMRNKQHDEKIFIYAEPVHTEFGWGYNIIADGKVHIKQEYMPAVPGKIGFKTAEDAMIVGNMVVNKISTNQLPAISVRELDSLGFYHDTTGKH